MNDGKAYDGGEKIKGWGSGLMEVRGLDCSCIGCTYWCISM